MAENGKNIKAECKAGKDGIGLTIETLFNGMEGLASSKTVIGEPVVVGELTMIPLIEVSAGMASGAFGKNAGHNEAGAMTAKVAPVAMLIVQGDRVGLVNVKNQDGLTKVLDMIPDAIDKITGKFNVSPEAKAEGEEKLSEMKVEVVDVDPVEVEIRK